MFQRRQIVLASKLQRSQIGAGFHHIGAALLGQEARVAVVEHHEHVAFFHVLAFDCRHFAHFGGQRRGERGHARRLHASDEAQFRGDGSGLGHHRVDLPSGFLLGDQFRFRRHRDEQGDDGHGGDHEQQEHTGARPT